MPDNNVSCIDAVAGLVRKVMDRVIRSHDFSKVLSADCDHSKLSAVKGEIIRFRGTGPEITLEWSETECWWMPVHRSAMSVSNLRKHVDPAVTRLFSRLEGDGKERSCSAGANDTLLLATRPGSCGPIMANLYGKQFEYGDGGEHVLIYEPKTGIHFDLACYKKKGVEFCLSLTWGWLLLKQ